MSATNGHESSQKRALTVQQLNAIDLLVQGNCDRSVAEKAGVARETVTRWRNECPHFAAELNRVRREVWGEAKDRLRALLGKAVDTLETAVEGGDVRAALEILKTLKLYGAVEPPSGPDDPELVLWAMASEWAEAELRKQGPRNPLLDVADPFEEGSKRIKLTRARMEELRGLLTPSEPS